ncbi:MAG: hypothetical protein ACP5D1_00925 [Bacteroidales bacterium]
MKKLKDIKYFYFVLLISSCNVAEKKELVSVLNNYLTGLSAFETELIDHFPFEFCENEIKEMSFVLPSALVKGEYSHAMLRIRPPKNKFDSLYVKIENSYILLDTNELSILNNNTKITNGFKPILIPDIKELFKNQKAPSNFIQEINFYVIESDTGNFTKYKLPMRKNFPASYQHGFSKGVGIRKTEFEIIYWLLIW